MRPRCPTCGAVLPNFGKHACELTPAQLKAWWLERYTVPQIRALVAMLNLDDETVIRQPWGR